MLAEITSDYGRTQVWVRATATVLALKQKVAGEPRLTAAIPMENHCCCSCKLTRRGHAVLEGTPARCQRLAVMGSSALAGGGAAAVDTGGEDGGGGGE